MRLLAQAACLSLQLELERLGGLAGEPQFTPLRIPAEALRGHSRHRRREQLGQRYRRQRPGELGGVLPNEHDQAAEPGRAGVLEQLEAASRILDDDRCRAVAECRGNGGFTARLDFYRAQRQRLAPLRQRTGCRRQAFSLGQGALDGDGTRFCQPCLLGEVVAVPVHHGRTQAFQQVRRSFAAHFDSLARAAEPIESPGGALLSTRHRGQLALGALALREQGIEP